MSSARALLLQVFFITATRHMSQTDGHEALCQPPPTVPNAEVEWSDRTLGAYVIYTCRYGFVMAGPADTVVMYCSDTGRWTSSIRPECMPIQCPSPEIPAFGNVTFVSGDGQYGSTIVYRCDEFYERVGPLASQCMADRTWSFSAPVCRLRCDSPTTPNGVIEQLNNHVCLEYSSADDQRLDWQASLQHCRSYGGSLALIRDRNRQTTISNRLPYFVNGEGTENYWIGATEVISNVQSDSRNWIWANNAVVRTSFWGPEEPTSATDSDSRGECVDLDATTDYQWNDNNCSVEQGYICQFGEGGMCGDPGVPDHVVRTLLGCDKGFLVGCLITYRCQPGYRLVGESSSDCLKTSRWSKALPSCEPRRCSQPPPQQTRAEILSDLYRGTAVYRCPSESYPSRGDVFAFCRQDGSWNMPSIQCLNYATSTTTASTSTDPDWTFVGIVGALGILLLFATFVIIVLVAVRNRNLNSRKCRPPLPSTAGRKRRSDDVTYYSIRNMNRYSAPDTNQQFEMSKKRLSDVGEEKGHKFAQQDVTYNRGTATVDDGAYLEPIRTIDDNGSREVRMSSGEYENPMSPRSGTYDQVTDDDTADDLSENDLLNNYIILQSDDESSAVRAPAGSDVVEVKVEGAMITESDGNTVVTAERNVGEIAKEERDKVSVVARSDVSPVNGLERPLSYTKNDYGSTIEL